MKYLIAAILTLTFQPANAFFGKYRVYTCVSEQDAYQCKRCERIKSLELEFDVNTSNQSVFVTYYSDGKKAGVESPKNCSVISSRKWQCNDGSGDTRRTTSVSDGIYTQTSRNVSYQSLNSYYCAK